MRGTLLAGGGGVTAEGEEGADAEGTPRGEDGAEGEKGVIKRKRGPGKEGHTLLAGRKPKA